MSDQIVGLSQKFAVELLGTFIFVSVIFRFMNHETGAIAIGIALIAAILFGGPISGGHFNPAVSLSMYAAGKITVTSLIVYIIAQVLAGYGAYSAFRA